LFIDDEDTKMPLTTSLTDSTGDKTPKAMLMRRKALQGLGDNTLN